MIDRGSRDDFERIRLKMAGQRWRDDNLAGGGVPAFVGQVTTAASLIGVGKFLKVQPIFVMGPEVEGGGGQFSATASSSVPVYLVGPGLASTGDYLVCRFVDNRWVAERTTLGSGGQGANIVGCFCTSIPMSLTMTSSSSTCNYGMFQSCAIEYGPTPSEFEALDLGVNSFLSTGSFPDPIEGGALFRYYLVCNGNQFNLTRVYLPTANSAPFRDGLLYSWLIGAYGNTCVPFHLDNGTAFPGSDPSCTVTIDGA